MGKDDYAYQLFQLKNKEFTYTVDDSTLDCGLNGALYFVQMDADGGKSKYGNAGAEMGLGYCDAQCPQVTTQFITDDGSDSGKLTEVKQFYTQDGKTIEHPMYNVNGNTYNDISDDYCNDWVATTKDSTNFEEMGGLAGVEKAIDAGVVLVMSVWDDHSSNMLWLDSNYPVDSTDPGTLRGYCSADSGKPEDVESAQANSHVIFSDIKFGPIGC